MLAPHEGKEWYLVLMGKKPFAVVEKNKDPVQYNHVLDNPDFYTFRATEHEIRFWSKDNKTGYMNNSKYVRLVMSATSLIQQHGLAWYQREMGRLFGYTEKQIDAFINGDVKCNCAKCKGVSHAEV